MHAFLHVDDPERAQAYLSLLADDAPSYEELDQTGQAYARMLFFNLWDNAGGYTSYAQGLAALRPQRALRDELRQVLSYVIDRADHVPIPLSDGLGTVPLKVHSSYNRSEILAALGIARFGGQMPRSFAQGVQWAEETQTDALLITLEKDEKDFAHRPVQGLCDQPEPLPLGVPERDFPDSATGKRYQQHAGRGSHVLLFMRRYATTDTGKSQPWMLLGPATYVRHTGSKPMAITWHLDHDLPADVWTYSAAIQAS